MTKEDVSEDVRGEAVLGWASTRHHQRPIIHQVASAPMPSDCGEAAQTHTRRVIFQADFIQQ